jgi:hypothetical protein
MRLRVARFRPQHITVRKRGSALHIDALTLVNTLHLLTLCRLAARLAHHRCPPPLSKDGRPCIPCASQKWKRGNRAGAPLPDALFVLTVLTALSRQLIGARDLIIDSAPILACRRADPDAAVGHAPAQHPRPFLRGYRVHTLLCRGSGLPLFFLLSLQPMSTMRRLLNLCWLGPPVSTRSVRA